MHIDFAGENIKEGHIFNVGHMLEYKCKYKNIFAKGYVPNWSEDVLMIKKVRNTVLWTYVINDLNREKTVGTFYEKELQKIDQNEFRVEKVIKRKSDKLYVK